jgi:hypothetical protein
MTGSNLLAVVFELLSSWLYTYSPFHYKTPIGYPLIFIPKLLRLCVYLRFMGDDPWGKSLVNWLFALLEYRTEELGLY